MGPFQIHGQTPGNAIYSGLREKTSKNGARLAEMRKDWVEELKHKGGAAFADKLARPETHE